MKRSKPTKKELEEVFEYRDGDLWIKAYSYKRGKPHPEKVIKSTSNTKNNYCEVRFRGIRMYYHRIVWILVNGDIPKNMQIDHIDGDTVNNSLSNLRLVSIRQNQQNRSMHRNGRLPGCYYNKQMGKWLVQAMYNGKQRSLGYYPTELEAHNAYVKFLEENGLSRLVNDF